MIPPAKYISLQFGEGQVWVENPPAGLEAVVSGSGRFLALIWPEADGRFRVDGWELRTPPQFEHNTWVCRTGPVQMASHAEAQTLTRQMLESMNQFPTSR
jgi:hypothetical protein